MSSDGTPKPSRLEMIDKMLAAKPDDPFPRYARAMELRSQGRGAEALEEYGRVTQLFPAYVPSYLMGAQVAAELGQVQEARAWAERGVAAATKADDDHALSELRSFMGTLAGGEPE